jgi:two-component system NarL family response regulator
MRVLIVEDDPLLRGNLSILLAGEPGFSVCAACSTAEEALTTLAETRPDILISDIGLPGMSGIELIRSAKEQLPDLDIIAYTVFDDRETLFKALKAGASGYMLKGSSPKQIIEALLNLRAGGAPMSPKIARIVIREFQETGHDEQTLLTTRETEILRYLEKGNSYKVIADSCGISPHTVTTHIKNIYEKLHSGSRQEAIAKARKKGLL